MIMTASSMPALPNAPSAPLHDLVLGQPAQRQAALAQQQATVVAAWMASDRPVDTDIGIDASQPEPKPFAVAMSTSAMGCNSPLAASAGLKQLYRTVLLLRQDPPESQAAMNVLAREIRARLQEIRPRNAIEGSLASQLIAFDEAVQALLARMGMATTPMEVSLFAMAIEKLTKAKLETLRHLERRRRARKPSTRVVVRDQAQAVIGDVHLHQQR